MGKDYDLSIFIFRRDLRRKDNTALNEALKRSKEVLPIFVFDPAQVGSSNDYRSRSAIYFMVNSLKELAEEIPLVFLHGAPHKELAKVVQAVDAQAVFFNKDYTPYSQERDSKIAKKCEKLGVDLVSCHDILLLGEIKETKSGKGVYHKFTPFHKAFKRLSIDEPYTYTGGSFYSRQLRGISKVKPGEFVDGRMKFDPPAKGGRKEGKKMLKDVIEDQEDYNDLRDCLTHATSRLSAHINFGTISCREAHRAFKKAGRGASALIEQLFWRDFYYSLIWENPEALKKSYNEKYDDIKWSKSKARFEAWVEGRTGFPVVDACMREIAETNYMHNRGRMIVASFLVKDLLLDWRKGEKYFCQQLYDINAGMNNGNWCWVVGNASFAQPYFRVFNPWTQGKKFDPEAEYIKHWVPELAEVPAKDIHRWDQVCEEYIDEGVRYPKPIVDHDEAKKEFLSRYKEAFN